MKIINCNEFDLYWKNAVKRQGDPKTDRAVKKIIADVKKNGDKAIRKYASKWDRSSPEKLEVSVTEAKRALEELRATDPSLIEALEFSARNLKDFSAKQREQFANFEYEIDTGLFTGQRIIPVEKAAVYVPGGRFPLFSSVLMCMIPAFCAGVEEVILSSPPAADGLPDKKILAAAAIAANAAGISPDGTNGKRFRIFAIGGAQAVAAFAYGTETVPRVDVIAGPGNRFVIAAKRQLFGEVGIDFLAGPSDVLVILGRTHCVREKGTGNNSREQLAISNEQLAGKREEGTGNGEEGRWDGEEFEKVVEIVAADMLAQAEHDPDARARAIVPDRETAGKIADAIERRLSTLPTAKNARASLDAGGLIVVYESMEEAIRITNKIAPEHLELQVNDADAWIPKLKNYGSLFIGAQCAEVLGDYSAGVNHTLPTETSARFTGGLSVRHFLKTVTTLRCENDEGFQKARNAASVLARAEGLEAHALSAEIRKE